MVAISATAGAATGHSILDERRLLTNIDGGKRLRHSACLGMREKATSRTH
ncbi:hypothetical protein OMCYN_00889 [cyanobiont of Ornithocercus magnificus]|nr:hypothetical protein OMCYN_00889 [cyanobiont of Ornithocercus magnificus]